MSRNLGDTSCAICRSDVALVGSPHPIARDEAGVYFPEYEKKQLVVADAVCMTCNAKYLAWIRCGTLGHLANRGDAQFVDLSFRRSFNDEPAPEDLPAKEKLTEIHRAERLEAARESRLEAARLRMEATQLDRAANECERQIADGESFWECFRR